MKIRFCYFFLLCFLTCIKTQGQNVITGQVKSDSKPLESINVQLFCNDTCFVTGTTTSATGTFSIGTDKQEKLSLVFSAVGFEQQRITMQGKIGKATNIGIVTMQESSVMLEEVTVTTQRYLRKPDKVLIFPDQKQVKYAATGYDLLSNLMIPGINVDRLNKSVTTPLGNVTLYIDGVKATRQEVQMLRPKDIARVEYHDMPQDEFGSDIASINYITKQRDAGGYVTLSGEQRLGYLFGEYMAASKYVRKNMTYTAVAGYGMETNKVKGWQTDEIALSEETYDRQTDMSAKMPNNNKYVAFTARRQMGKDYWKIRVGYVNAETPGENLYNLTRYSGIEKNVTSHDHAERSSHKPYADFTYYNRINSRQWLKLTLNAAYTRNQYERAYQEENLFTEGMYDYHVQTDEDYFKATGDVTYNWKLKNKATLTGSLYHTQTWTIDRYTGDIQSRQKLISGSSIFYMAYNQRLWQKLQARLALGGGYSRYGLRGDRSQKTFSPRPSLRLQYAINSHHSLNFYGHMADTYIELSEQSEVEQKVDHIQVKRGNPELEIGKLITSSLQYTYLSNNFSLSADVRYFAETNCQKYDFFEDNAKLVQSYITEGKHHGIVPHLSTTVRLLDNNLSFMADVSFLHDIVTGKNAITKSSWQGSVRANYTLRSLQIQAYYNSPTKEFYDIPYYVRRPASYGLSVGYFKNAFMMEVGTFTPFQSGMPKHSRSISTDIYNSILTVKENSTRAMAYIKLSYSFNFGKKVKQTAVDMDNEVNSAIFK